MQSNKPVITPDDLKKSCDPGQWVQNYADYLYNYAFARINDNEQAQDLIQETFLAALEKITKFEGKSSEKTWLTAILKNKIVDFYRKNSSGLSAKTEVINEEDQKQNFFNFDDGHWKNEHAPKEFIVTQEDAMHNKEFQWILQSCMKKLPKLWNAIFSMKHIDEESTELICTTLKVTPANFWVIIHRTKLNLRACLQKNWI